MAKVAVVADTTAGIPKDVLQRYSIFMIPLHLIWGDKTYLDTVDIQPGEFYEKLAAADQLPTTSQPSPQAFVDIYSRLLGEGHDIISIHISSKLSGTVDSAQQAKKMIGGDARIEIIDSLTTGMEMGFHVLKAAEAARNGATLEECKEIALKLQKKSGIYFMVDTLEFLRRGGRIGGAAAFLGTILNLKPILEIRDGRIEAVEKVRSQTKALNRLLDLVENAAQGKKIRQIAALHSNAIQTAQTLLDQACERFQITSPQDRFLSDVSPVIGTHTGPGCIGIAYLTD